jgi:hypothetical protein
MQQPQAGCIAQLLAQQGGRMIDDAELIAVEMDWTIEPLPGFAMDMTAAQRQDPTPPIVHSLDDCDAA